MIATMLRSGASMQRIGGVHQRPVPTAIGVAAHRILPRRPIYVHTRAAVRSAEAATLPGDVKSVLFTSEEIADKVAELAAAVCADHAASGGGRLALIGVLNGAFILTSDLARQVSASVPDVKVDFLRASSYGAASESSGAVKVQGGGALDRWSDHHIVLVEDIIDSGHTLLRLSKLLSDAGAPSVKVLALLDKRGRRRVDCVPDYVGWECPDEFVVGYGLDFNERYRCLPYLAALREEAYAGH